MNSSRVIILLIGCLLIESVVGVEERKAEEDNEACVACTMALTIVEDVVDDDIWLVDQLLAGLCTLLPPGEDQEACELLIETVGLEVLKELLKEYNADYICHALGICTDCYLFGKPSKIAPLPHASLTSWEDHVKKNFAARLAALTLRYHVVLPREQEEANEEGAPKDVYPNAFNDIDGDHFAQLAALRRGSYWRGKDCNDIVANVHPGAAEATALVDGNCNGISGVDPENGKGYEAEFCASSNASHIVTFGDSASAAFHIPEEWMRLEGLGKLPEAAIQTFNVPAQSWSTGFLPWVGNDSVLLQMTQRNRCNHRSFQNLARNGATIGSFGDWMVETMTPSEIPMMGFLAMIGNDICKSSLSRMTTTEQFKERMVTGLHHLASVVPPHSKLMNVGLVDGRILWNTMHARTHPLGCTYAQFYEFLTCCDANPCNTWLTPDEATRDAATARAKELSDTMEQVVGNYSSTFPNLELSYISFMDMQAEVVKILAELNVDPAILIEAVDGFHPSPLGQRVIAEASWIALQETVPEWLGPVNRHNGRIHAIFEDQNGY